MLLIACVLFILSAFVKPLIFSIKMSYQKMALTPLFKTAVWFQRINRSLQASVHIKEELGRIIILSPQTKFCVISQANLPIPQDRRDIAVEPTLITCVDIEGTHAKVVGRTTLKIHFLFFAMKIEFLVTEYNPGQSHPIILGRDFIDQYVESPLTDSLLSFLIPEDIFISCSCAGLYCHCRPPRLAIRYYPVRDNDEE